MNANLLSLSLDALGSDFARLSANLLRESHVATQSALDLLLPVVIASLAQKGTTSQGGDDLATLIGVAKLDANLIDNIEGLLTGPTSCVNNVLKVGTVWLIPGLFGDASASLVIAVSAATGIARPSTITLLAILVAVVLNVAKRQNLRGRFVSGSWCSLLRSQQAYVRYKLDSRITAAAKLPGPTEFPDQLGSQQEVGGECADETVPGGIDATPVTKFRRASWLWRFVRSRRQVLGLGD